MNKDTRIAYICILITGMCFGTMEVSCKLGGMDLDQRNYLAAVRDRLTQKAVDPAWEEGRPGADVDRGIDRADL